MNLNMNLSPDQSRFVQECVDSGEFANVNAVFEAGLDLLARRSAAIADARRKIQEGAECLDRGEILELEEVMNRLRAKHDRILNQQAKAG